MLSNFVRMLWLILGLIFVALGIIGALLPLMPTTIFLILAAGCFARSSARLEAWLMGHRHFGPALQAWRAERAIPVRAKRAACIGMAVGYALFWLSAHPSLWLAIGVGAMLVACATYVVTRPTATGPATGGTGTTGAGTGQDHSEQPPL